MTTCSRCKRPLADPTSVENGMGPICAARFKAERAAGQHATYEVVKVDPKQAIVWIVDRDLGRSVTNDADRVTSELHERYPFHRIIYRDTAGFWDELRHDAGRFTGYAPARDMGLCA